MVALRVFAAAALSFMPITGAPARSAVPPIPFVCAVTGGKLLKPAMTTDAVCARFAAPLEAAMGRPLKTAREGLTDKNWIRLDVRLSKPGVAAATLTQSKNGRVFKHPEIAVATSDRPLDSSSIDILARDLARMMASTGQR
jgi:hypothetical protein